jgi:2-haloacid dehalogenase
LIAVQALLFDLYGTLVDEMPGYRHFLQSRLGIKGDANSFIKQWFLQQRRIVFSGEYIPFREVLQKSLKLAAGKSNISLPDTIENEDFLGIFSNIGPFPEVPAALRNLKKKARLGILTNSDAYMLAPILPRLGVQFDAVLSAESIKAYKPNRQAYQRALDSLAAPLEEILFVSGTPWDAKAAGEFGFAAAFVKRRALQPDAGPSAKYSIKDLGELARIMADGG